MLKNELIKEIKNNLKLKNEKVLNKILLTLIIIFIPFYITFNFPIFSIMLNKIELILTIFTVLIFILLWRSTLNITTIISTMLCISIFTLHPKLQGVLLISLLFYLLNKRYVFIYNITFVLISLGILCSFILEYGEVSNLQKFTITNIVLTLIFMPILILITVILLEKARKVKINKKI
ncbi:hypothetical protein [[Clostridium] colinum]|uniref:hypothetical protein n=1 Tax=[Clostridium] colinum TaxID=36835 RepID=UPI00202560FA|nr:hypothetical protein [[Clostridium] colinum]